MEKLEQRQKEIESEFSALEEQRKQFVEQRKGIDQSLSQIQAKQLELRGAHSEVRKLLEEIIPKETPEIQAEIIEPKNE